MSAKCYLCDNGHTTIPGRPVGDALGTCQNCSILVCDAHAQRDPNYPRFICVLCDTSLLTAAAIASSGGVTLNTALTSLISSALVRQGARYETLEQFIDDRPDYRWIRGSIDQVLKDAPQRFTTDLSEPFWFRLSTEGQKFVAAAILLVEKLQISEDELVEALRILVIEWRSRG